MTRCLRCCLSSTARVTRYGLQHLGPYWRGASLHDSCAWTLHTIIKCQMCNSVSSLIDSSLVVGPVQDEASPLGKFKELDELLYDSNAAAGSGLSELLPYARTALGTSPSCAPRPASAAAASGSCDSQPAEAGNAPGASGTDTAAAAAAAEAAQLSPADATPAKGSAASAGLSVSERQTLEQQLACVCDVRKVDEASYYRLNDQRVRAGWRAGASFANRAVVGGGCPLPAAPLML